MTLKASTGLRNKILTDAPLRTVLDLGTVKIYAGAVPASADDALGAATLLSTITNASTATGLTMDTAAVDGVLLKAPAEVWSGVNGAGGTATFYRHVAVGDTGVASTTQARVQGSIGIAGADMNLTSTTLANGATQTVDFYTLNLPTL
jgi:hypothetical protein